MKTVWNRGQNILYDGPVADSIRDVTVTKVSSHLLVTYLSTLTTANKSHYLRMETAAGALHQPIPLAVNRNHIQRDACIAAINGTDDFIAVWSSNHEGVYQIYARRFHISPDHLIEAPYPEVLINGGVGNSLAPRIIYNPASKLIFISWVAASVKELQGIYLNSDTLEAESYPISVSKTVHANFSLTTFSEMYTDTATNIVLLCQNDTIMVIHHKNANSLAFVTVSKPVEGASIVSEFYAFEREALGKFDAVLNNKTGYLMLVYLYANALYGKKVRLFTGTESTVDTGSEFRLNLASITCLHPSLSLLGDSENTTTHLLSWAGSGLGTFYNIFDENFNLIGNETRINNATHVNSMPLSISSDVQIAIIFDSTIHNTLAMTVSGVIKYIENIS